MAHEFDLLRTKSPKAEFDSTAVSHPFDLLRSKPEPTISDNLGDIGRLALQGTAGIGGAVGLGLQQTGIAPELGKTLRESSASEQQRLGAKLTPEMQSAQAEPLINSEYQQDTEQGSSFVNPKFGMRSLAANVVPSIPGSLAMAVPGGIAAKGIELGAKALGAGKTIAPILGRSLGFGGSEGVFSGLSNADQWGTEQRAKPIETFMQHPAWNQALADNGNNPEAAKESLIQQGESDIVKDTSLKTGAISGLTGGGAAGMLMRNVEKPVKGIIGPTLKSMGVEAAQESPQSFYENKTTNQATQRYIDTNQDINAGNLNAGILGGVAGGVMGSIGIAGPLSNALRKAAPPASNQTILGATNATNVPPASHANAESQQVNRPVDATTTQFNNQPDLQEQDKLNANTIERDESNINDVGSESQVSGKIPAQNVSNRRLGSAGDNTKQDEEQPREKAIGQSATGQLRGDLNVQNESLPASANGSELSNSQVGNGTKIDAIPTIDTSSDSEPGSKTISDGSVSDGRRGINESNNKLNAFKQTHTLDNENDLPVMLTQDEHTYVDQAGNEYYEPDYATPVINEPTQTTEQTRTPQQDAQGTDQDATNISEFGVPKAVQAEPVATGSGVVDGLIKNPIDQAAHASATSPTNELVEPTEAQKEAGNFKKGHIQNYHGLNITIENPQGSVRSGVNKQGKSWERVLPNHYGYIKGTIGADKDHVDVFLGNNHESDKAYVVNQINPDTGNFDEHKVMLGFNDKQAASDAYHANYPQNWKGMKSIAEMPIEILKKKIKEPLTKKEFKDEQIKATNINPTTPQEGTGTPTADVFTGQGTGAKKVDEKTLKIGDRVKNNILTGKYAATARTGTVVNIVKDKNNIDHASVDWDGGGSLLAPLTQFNKVDVINEAGDIAAQSDNAQEVLTVPQIPEQFAQDKKLNNLKTKLKLFADKKQADKHAIATKAFNKHLDKLKRKAPESALITTDKSPGHNQRVADMKEELSFKDAARKRNAFTDKHKGKPFAQSLINNDFEKASDDIERGYVSIKDASIIFNDAKESGLLNDLTTTRIEKKLNEQTPPTSEKENKIETAGKEAGTKKPIAESYKTQSEYHAAVLAWKQQINTAPIEKSEDQIKLDELNRKVALAKKANDRILNKPQGAVPMSIGQDAFRNANNKYLKLVEERDAHVAKMQGTTLPTPLAEEQVNPQLAVTNTNNEASNWIKKNVSKDQIETLQTRFNENKEFQRDADKFNRYARTATGHIEGSKAIDFYSAFAPDINVTNKESLTVENTIDRDAKRLLDIYNESGEQSANDEFQKIATDNGLKAWEQDALVNKFQALIKEQDSAKPIKQIKPTKRKTVSKENAAHLFGQDKKIGYGKENTPFSKAENAQKVIDKKATLDNHKVIQSGDEYWIVHNNYPMQDVDVDAAINKLSTNLTNDANADVEKEGVESTNDQPTYIGINIDNEKIYEKSDGSRYIDHGNLIENESISIVPTQQGVKIARNERKSSFKTTDEYVKDNVDTANANLPYSFEIKDNGESLGLYHNGKAEIQNLSRINGVSEAIRHAHLINERNIKKEKSDRDNIIKAAKDSGTEPTPEMAKLDADIDDLLGEIGQGILSRLSMKAVPEEEVDLLPLISKLMGLLVKKGYLTFEANAHQVIALIRDKFGDKVADNVHLDELKGGYIGMRKGTTSQKDVVSYDSIEQLEKYYANDTRTKTNASDTTSETINQPGVPTKQPGSTKQEGVESSQTGLQAGQRQPVAADTRESQGNEVPTNEPMGGQQTSGSYQSTIEQPDSTDGSVSGNIGRDNYDLRDKPNVVLYPAKRRDINNLAVEILKKPVDEITEADKDILRQYTGSGGLDAKASADKGEAVFNQHYTNYDTIKAMYSALLDAGVKMGNNLEPSVGSGNFIGMYPTANWSAVDVDKTNTQVVERLYPNAKVSNESYETFRGKNFDLIISNVPFASFSALARQHAGTIKPAFKAIHNFFFAQSIDKAKTGGVVAFMTSTGTMDSIGEAQKLREHIVKQMDVIGAYRLPMGSQKANASTEVMIDVIFLQKRPEGVASKQPVKNQSFVDITSEQGHKINKYFVDYPESVLGDLSVGKNKTSMGKIGLIVTGEPDYSAMKVELQDYTSNKKSDIDQFKNPETAQKYADKKGLKFVDNRSKPYFNDGIIYDKPVTYSETEGSGLFGRKATGVFADKLALLKQINDTHDIELINKYEDKYSKAPHNDKQLEAWSKENHASQQLKSYLSLFDKHFNPSEIFTKQVRFEDSGKIEVTSESPLIERAESLEDADGFVKIKNDLISEEEIQSLLDDNSYAKVDNNRIQNARLYYAGNIYQKLDDAKKVKPSEQREKQIARLEKVKPPVITIDKISITGKESWLPQEALASIGVNNYADGTRIIGDKAISDNHLLHLFNQYVNNDSLVSKDSKETPEEYIDRLKQAQNILHNEVLPLIKQKLMDDGLADEVVDAYNRSKNFFAAPIFDGSSLHNLPTTFKGKPFSLMQHQQEGAERAIYNKKGVLAFSPGLGKTPTAIIVADQLLQKGVMKKPLFVVPANTISQWEASARSLYPNAKIFEFPKYSSGINKGKVKDWTAMNASDKEKMIYDLTNNRYDFTFISTNLAQKISIPDAKLNQYLDELVESIQGMEKPDEELTKAQIKAKATRIAKLRMLKTTMLAAYMDDTDSGFDLGKLGFDALFADEVQYYKNIGMQSEDAKGGIGANVAITAKYPKVLQQGDNWQGTADRWVEDKTQDPLSVTLGSSRSYDFRFKTRYISEANNGNNVFLLTGTPTPNKPLELMTLLHHLDIHILDAYGISNVGEFVDEFLDVQDVEEVGLDGTNKMRPQLVGIKNIPALKKIITRYIDYRSPESAKDLTRPKQVDITHTILRNDDAELIFADIQARIMQSIEDANAKMGGDKTVVVEPMITMYGAGRDGSIDVRLYSPTEKSSVVSSEDLFEKETREDYSKIAKTVKLVTTQLQNDPGSGQLIFLDRLKFAGDRGSTHEDIRDDVIASTGLDPKQVIFVNGSSFVNPDTGKVSNNGPKPEQLQRIMDYYNEGKIKVLIGNTSKLGVGVDLQVTTTDIYQIDKPYRPDEIEQRNNRGVRQGNRNPIVRVHTFNQPGTFDAMSDRIIANKQGFNDVFWKEQEGDKADVKPEEAPNRYDAAIELEQDPIKKRKLEIERDIAQASSKTNNLEKQISTLAKRIRVANENKESYVKANVGIDNRETPKYEDQTDKERKLSIASFKKRQAEQRAKNVVRIADIEKDLVELNADKAIRESELADHKQHIADIRDKYVVNGVVSVDAIRISNAFQFSKADTVKSGNTHTPTSLKTAMQQVMDREYGDGYTNRLFATGKFKIIDRQEANKIIGNRVTTSQEQNKVQGFYLPSEDISYLVADNINKGKDLIGLMLHEVASHQLLLNKDQKEFNDILDQLEGMRGQNQAVNASFTRALESFGLVDLPVSDSITQRTVRRTYSNSDLLAAKSTIQKLFDQIEVENNSPVSGGVKPVSFEQGFDASTRAVKDISNLLKGHSSIAEFFSSSNVEDRAKMLLSMSRIAHNDKILNSVIRFIPIEMMNNLISGKFSSNMQGHNVSMGVDLITMNGNDAIASRVNMAGRVFESMVQAARLRAKDNAVRLLDSKGNGINISSTPSTGNVNSGLGSIGVSKANRTGVATELPGIRDRDSAFSTGIGSHNIAPSNNVDLDKLLIDISNLSPTSSISRNDVLQEAISYLLESYPRLSISQRLIAWMRKAIRNLGKALPALERMKWVKWANSLNEKDVVYMAISALKQAPESLLMDSVGRSGDTILMAKQQGYKGENKGEAKEWLRAKAKGLDMSQDARMARAKSMGFDVDKVWYHGTQNSAFDSFDNTYGREKEDNRRTSGEGTISFSSDPEFASGYAGAKNADETLKYYASRPNLQWGGAGYVIPVYLKTNNAFDFRKESHINKAVDFLDNYYSDIGQPLSNRLKDGIVHQLKQGDWGAIEHNLKPSFFKDNGFVGAYVKEQGKLNIIEHDPSTIRSIHAAFDKDYAESGNLLASKKESAPAYNEQDKAELESLFKDLSPRAKPATREAAQSRINDFKDNDKIRYVEENFYDMLGALEESGKVVIKC